MRSKVVAWRTLVRTPLLVAITFAALQDPGRAQDQPPPAPATAAAQDQNPPPAGSQDQNAPAAVATATVTVTGSRIVTPNATSISPVLAVQGDAIVNTGRTSVEDYLNTIPQIFGSQNSSVSNGSNGVALVNLRDLDSKRTLVLINGRRLGPGDPSSGFLRNSYGADLNFVPPALIERVDILTGGASSVYGADAVSGVVNFVMNTHFEGLKITAQYGFFRHDNGNAVQSVLDAATPPVSVDGTVDTGFSKDASVVFGVNTPDNKGNVTFYATYRNQAPIVQAKYDYGACTFLSGDQFACGGSSTSGPPYSNGRFNLITNPVTGTTAPKVTLGPGGTLVPFTNNNLYNYGALNYYQRPDERYSGGSFANYEWNDHAHAYGEFMFMRDDTTSQVAPSGAFYGGYPFDPNNNGALTVNCSNPYLSSAELAAWCAGSTAGNTQLIIGRRNVEGGPRQQSFTHQGYRFVLGARGDIDDAWKYDTYFQYGQVELTSLFTNDVSWTNVQNSLLVNNVGGVPTCQATISGADPRCVPWNIFQPGGVTPAATNYLSIPLLQQGTVTERVFNMNFTGDLGKYHVQLPTAKSGLIVNAGFEWRQEKSNFQPDQSYITNLGAGQGGATLPVSGGYTVRELFTEARMPVIEDAFLAQSLSLEGGYRWSDYSLGFKTNTYKIGLEWQPTDDVRLRGTFQRAVRVPNVGELYSPQSVQLDGVTDPCAGPTPALTAAQCAHTGVTAAQYGTIDANPSAQYNGFLGGNPNLQPETAITKSIGITFTPRWVDGLRFTIDYFDINIQNAIQNPNADFTLLLCAETGDPTTCGRIHRSNSGSLWTSPSGFVTDTLANIGSIATRGFDIDTHYQLKLDRFGKIDLSLVGTYTDTFKTTPQPGATYECAGYFGGVCQAPLPKWRHTFTVNWDTPVTGLSAMVAWRYLDSVSLDAFAPGLPFLGGAYGAGAGTTGAPATDTHLSSMSYFDTSIAYQYNKYMVRVGVNNILDKDPPLNGSTTCPVGPCNGNTWPVIYDATGRFIYAMISAEF
jgi:outer membrane receptor protein involved in Fe transport